MNDFRKYATQHLGMSGMVIDDVIKTQDQILVKIFLSISILPVVA